MSRKRKQVPRPLAWCLAVAFLTLGLWPLAQSLWALRYESVQGTVLATSVEHLKAGKVDMHKPVIRYEYRVAGQLYQGSRYSASSFDEDGGQELWAIRVAQSFVPGAPCTVYYQPDAPGQSVLRRGPTGATWFISGVMLFLGSVFTVLALSHDSAPGVSRTPA